MIDTERLILRRWRDGDVDPFHAMGLDAEVMRYLGPPHSRAECEAAVARQNALCDADGHCFWALERRSDGAFIGFCGVKPGPEGTPVAGLPEIGWRLARDCWGQGYAREAAVASFDWMWANTAHDRIYAFTVPANAASRGLMTRLGMDHLTDRDFDHPAMPEGDPLRRHMLYALDRPRA